MSRVDELKALLPRAISREPAAQAFLNGVLTAVATLENWLDYKASRSRLLLDASEVPDELVPFLAGLVGVGEDLAAGYSSTVAEQRALIPVAVALWKRKGTRRSWRDVVRFLSGRQVLILDWFHHRIVAGSTLELHVIPAPGTSPGGNYDTPEQVSDVWVSDPDGGTDMDKLAIWLDVMRPANERINLYSALLVEDLQLGTNQWDIASPGANGDGLVDTPAVGLQSTAGNTYMAATPIPDDADNGMHVFMLLAVTTAAEILVLSGDADGDDSYGVVITNDAGTAGEVEIVKYVAGVPSTLATLAMPQKLVDGFAYRWRVDVTRISASATEIEVQWEAVTLGATTDSSSPHTVGLSGWRGGPGGSDRAILQQALIWRHHPTPTRVGPA